MSSAARAVGATQACSAFPSRAEKTARCFAVDPASQLLYLPGAVGSPAVHAKRARTPGRFGRRTRGGAGMPTSASSLASRGVE